MKLFSQRKSINLMLFLALIILGLSSSLAYLQIQRLIEANSWVIHTYKVIENVDQTQHLMTETETEISRYLLTKDKKYIKDTSIIFNQINHILNNLILLTSDNPFQNANIKKLILLTNTKINLLKKIVQENLTDDKTTITLAESTTNIALKQQISDLTLRITEEERILLDMRNDYATDTAKRSNLVLIGAGILSETLFLLSILLLNYYLRQKDKIEIMQLNTQKELDKKNKRLELIRERYNLAVIGSKTGVWDWKVGTETVYFSPVLKDMLGYSKDEFPNLLSSFKNHIHPDDSRRVLALIEQHLKDKTTLLDMELRLRNKDGKYNWFRMVGKAIRNKQDKALRMAGSLIDISSQKEVEIMKNEFVSTVSHELRTPLTSIHGAISLLTLEGMAELSEEAKQLLLIAQNNSERLIRLINDILDMEKIESGRLKFNFSYLKLNDIVNETIAANQAYAQKFNVKLQLSKESATIYINTDHDRLIQVLTNLISNAIKFSPANEYVSVDINLINDKIARVSVMDKGAGIPEEFQSRIFQKFSQADSSSTRKKEGTGLGLNISKTIIEKMGGSIGFVTGKDKGTSFYIDIPIIVEAATSTSEPTSPALAAIKTHAHQILHIEDDKDLAKIVKTMLMDEADTVNVQTIKQATIELTEKNYDLAILDLKLPDGEATDLLPLLQQKNVPIIIFSAYECPQDLLCYANTILIKSKASIAELVTAIRKIISSKAASEKSGKNWQPRGSKHH